VRFADKVRALAQYDMFAVTRTWFVDAVGVVVRVSYVRGGLDEMTPDDRDRYERGVLRNTRAWRKAHCPSALALGGPHENENGRCVACGRRE
jgi:hypothetical protein